MGRFRISSVIVYITFLGKRAPGAQFQHIMTEDPLELGIRAVLPHLVLGLIAKPTVACHPMFCSATVLGLLEKYIHGFNTWL